MRKKLLTLLLALTCTVGAAGLGACIDLSSVATSGNESLISNDNSSVIQNEWGTVYTMKAAYAKAQSLGYAGSLEEFILLISGKDGEDGKDGIDGADGKDGIDGEDGKDGIDGKDGVGILSVEHNADGTLTIYYTDGTSVNVGKIDGEDGKDGADGEDGVDGKDGEDGKDGIDGADGKDGEDGKDGVGIASMEIDDKGHLIVTMTNGSVQDLGSVVSSAVGVVEVCVTENKTIAITLSNGMVLETMPLDVEMGAYVTKASINAKGEFIVHTSFGIEQNLGKIVRVYINVEKEVVFVFEDKTEYPIGKLNVGSATGTPCVHKFSDWVAGEEATCESLGFNSRACVYCGVLDYDFITAKGHKWEALSYILEAPTQSKNGTGIASCTVCEAAKIVVIDYQGDLDGDGLTNGEECALYNTDMLLMDTDGDGLTDGEEVVTYSTDPLNCDTDGDGANDGAEVKYGTDPLIHNDAFNVNVVIEVEEDIVKPGIQLDGVSGEQLNTLTIKENDYFEEAQTPGYMGQAYDYDIEGDVSGTIVFEFEQPVTRARSATTIDPIIYRYDSQKNALFPQATTVVGNVASANVEEFGSYILLDRRVYENQMSWIDNFGINNEGEYSALEIVLVIDDSGSMSSNDRYYQRLEVAKTLVEGLPENSKIGIVKFGQYTTKLTSTLISDKEVAVEYLTTPTYFQNDEGSTYMYGAINESFSLYQSTDDTTLKMMVVLSDGIAHDTSKHANVISTAQAKDVAIYTVGLGSSSSSYFTNYLKPLAEGTDAKFYLASNASGLTEIYDEIGQRIDIVTDTDGDELPDYYEDNMPTINGVQIRTDKNNKDTDGDRLFDGEEVKIVYVYNGATLETSTKLTFYGKIYSNPTLEDSDGDGVLDFKDDFPLDASRS